MNNYLFKSSLLILFAAAFLLNSCKSSSQLKEEGSTIFLVRHAEKQDDGTKDPDLTEEGILRAQKLATLLADAGITHIYSSDFKRTRNTAKPLADLLGLQTEIYNPGEPDLIAKKIINEPGVNMLIVGHSNSTPALCNALLGKKKYEALEESQYDHLYVIHRSGEHSQSLILKY